MKKSICVSQIKIAITFNDDSGDDEPLQSIYFAKGKLKDIIMCKRSLPNRPNVRVRTR